MMHSLSHHSVVHVRTGHLRTAELLGFLRPDHHCESSRQPVLDLKPKMFFSRQRPPDHEVNEDVEQCRREHAPLAEAGVHPKPVG